MIQVIIYLLLLDSYFKSNVYEPLRTSWENFEKKVQEFRYREEFPTPDYKIIKRAHCFVIQESVNQKSMFLDEELRYP